MSMQAWTMARRCHGPIADDIYRSENRWRSVIAVDVEVGVAIGALIISAAVVVCVYGNGEWFQ
jgi:hypothetical protein